MRLYNMWPTVPGFFHLVQYTHVHLHCSIYQQPILLTTECCMVWTDNYACFDKTAMDIAVSESMGPVLSTLTLCQRVCWPLLHYIPIYKQWFGELVSINGHCLEQKHTRYKTSIFADLIDYTMVNKEYQVALWMKKSHTLIDKGSLALMEKKRRHIMCEVYILLFLRNGPYIRIHIPTCIKLLESQEFLHFILYISALYEMSYLTHALFSGFKWLFWISACFVIMTYLHTFMRFNMMFWLMCTLGGDAELIIVASSPLPSTLSSLHGEHIQMLFFKWFLKPWCAKEYLNYSSIKVACTCCSTFPFPSSWISLLALNRY